MAVAATFEVDRKSLRELQSALRLYEKATKKDATYVCDRAAMNLAFRSFQFTPQATHDAFMIAYEGGLKETSWKGLQRNDNFYSPQRRARALIVWRLLQKGKGLPGTARINRLTNALLAGAIRRGFIRAGWLQAAKKLQKRVRASKPFGVTTRGIPLRRGKGDARYARETLVTFSEIMNQSTSQSATSPQALMKYGGEGLRKALRFVTDDIRTYALEKLKKQAAKFNKRR